MSRRPNLAASHGYSMIAVMLVMLATSLLAGAAFSAVGGDIPFARAAQDRKQAYAAAQAGLDYYLYQLARDNDYWTKCTDVPEISPGVKPPINQKDPATRLWRNVSGSEARFSLELLPANDEPACDKTRPEDTMLDAASGTFRIRSTGESRGERRSIAATFRRSSFLDYLYFTDYETSDPLTYPTQAQRDAADPRVRPVPRGAAGELQRHHVPQLRPDQRAAAHERRPADLRLAGLRARQDGRDRDLRPGVGRLGPLGRNGLRRDARLPGDRAPSRADPPGPDVEHQAQGHGARQREDVLRPDHGRAARLGQDERHVVQQRHRCAVHGDGRRHASERRALRPAEREPRVLEHRRPARDRLHRSEGLRDPHREGHVHEVADARLGRDILIDGDLVRSGDPVLGLVALNFVRMKHGVRNCSGACFVKQDYHVQAAILALQHSFIVDNYNSGAKRGTLKVDGAIAQRFRGRSAPSTPARAKA